MVLVAADRAQNPAELPLCQTKGAEQKSLCLRRLQDEVHSSLRPPSQIGQTDPAEPGSCRRIGRGQTFCIGLDKNAGKERVGPLCGADARKASSISMLLFRGYVLKSFNILL